MGAATLYTHPAEVKRQARLHLIDAANRLTAALDRVILALDEIDGDPDFEPSLGSIGASAFFSNQANWARGANDDREEACEDEGSWTDDAEPSLGSIGSSWVVGDQRHWAIGAADDIEEQCEDEGSDAEHLDTWFVNPDSPRQIGACWERGVSNTEAFTRRDDL